MKLTAYTIYDVQADRFNTPMFLANDAVAIRQIKNELLNPNSQISLSPEDFKIYKNGEYDDETGEITSINPTLVTEVKDIQLPQLKEVNS